MSQSMDRREKRVLFLQALYDEIDRWHAEHPQNAGSIVQVNYLELGEQLGFTPAETGQVVEYLKGEYLVKGVAKGSMTITHGGIIAVEELMLEREELASRPLAGVEGIPATDKDAEMIKVFISHSSTDAEFAELLADLLRSALGLQPEQIRCTSVAGYKLPTGADFSQLREELLRAPVFVTLISEASFSSVWALSEFGARWGSGKHIFPLFVPGARASMLKGPVSQLHVLPCDDQAALHQLIGDTAGALGIKHVGEPVYQRMIDEVVRWAAGKADQGELVIVDATWGSEHHTSDLTDLLRSRIRNESLTIQATVQALGCDPAPNVRKALAVRYSYAGKTETVIVTEDNWLVLPPPPR